MVRSPDFRRRWVADGAVYPREPSEPQVAAEGGLSMLTAHKSDEVVILLAQGYAFIGFVGGLLNTSACCVQSPGGVR